jgi:beta-lactam-binding protein with PASTA domain
VVSVTEVHSTSKASGLVIGQAPMGGAELEPGGVVTIAVSARAQAVKQVKMPDVVGLRQSSAESKVKNVGLVPYITYGRVGAPNGQVISQWPLPGELLPVGAEGFIQVQLNP